MGNIDRYLKIVKWARKRYTVKGSLTISVGGKPSVYSRIENAAARKHLDALDHWNNEVKNSRLGVFKQA